MTERITLSKVTFHQPFHLRGVDGVTPAGTYAVDVTEELIPGVSVVAYRRVGTTITLPGASRASASRQVIDIDPDDLAAALERDKETAIGKI